MSLQLPPPGRQPTPVPDAQAGSGSGGRAASVAIRHSSVARAAVSPSAVVVTAAGAGIGYWADPHTAVLAIILGAGAWAARVGAAMFRTWRRRLPTNDIDPWAVPEPWRQYVRQAIGAQQRFDQTLSQWAPGPLHDRLVRLQPQLSRGAEEVWAVARQGAALGGGTTAVLAGAGRPPSIAQLSGELRKVQAERQRIGAGAVDRQAALARSEDAVAAQLRAAARSQDATAEILDRLRVLTARLDEAVTQLLSLGLEQVSGSGHDSADAVTGSVDALLEEIAALHQGLREAGAASSGHSRSGGGTGDGTEPPSPPARS